MYIAAQPSFLKHLDDAKLVSAGTVLIVFAAA